MSKARIKQESLTNEETQQLRATFPSRLSQRVKGDGGGETGAGLRHIPAERAEVMSRGGKMGKGMNKEKRDKRSKRRDIT